MTRWEWQYERLARRIPFDLPLLCERVLMVGITVGVLALVVYHTSDALRLLIP